MLWNCFGMWASFSTRVEFMDWSSRAYLTYTCLKCIISPSWATVCRSTFAGGWLEGPSSPCTYLVAACANYTGLSLGSACQELIVPVFLSWQRSQKSHQNIHECIHCPSQTSFIIWCGPPTRSVMSSVCRFLNDLGISIQTSRASKPQDTWELRQ